MAQSVYSRFGQSNITGTQQSQEIHVVKGDEQIPAIAAVRYGTGYDAILWRSVADANGIEDLDTLSSGTALIIPPPPTSET